MRLTWLCSTSRPVQHQPPVNHTSLSQTSKPAALRLGERLRQLRVSAGLTQSELAGDRFSKEYVSQIERGKTRPTGETIAWLASRLEHGRGLSRTRCLDRRAGPRRGNPDARRGARRGAPLRGGCRGVRRGSTRGRCHRREGARSATALGRGLGEDAAGRASRVARVAHAREDRRRRRAVLGSRPRRGALSPRCLPLQAFQHLDRDRPFQRGLHDRGALRASVRPAPLEHPRLPLALLPAPARPRGCA